MSKNGSFENGVVGCRWHIPILGRITHILCKKLPIPYNQLRSELQHVSANLQQSVGENFI